MVKLFGWEIKRKEDEETPSFTPKQNDEGAVIVAAGGSYGTYFDMDGTVRSEAELISRYREMSINPEMDTAIDEIVNEAIVSDEENPIVEIAFDENASFPPLVKKVIEQEFDEVLQILEFNQFAYEIFRRWYIDGRLYYNVMIDPKNTIEGIQEVRLIDPRKIRKIREVKRNVDKLTGATITQTKNEYYMYNERGFAGSGKMSGGAATSAAGIRIAKDSVVHITSGLTNADNTMVMSYLHKAIKPLNQLRSLEDAAVIYRLSRAPERRVWYIDVGNLPKMKAEQYLRDIMIKHKNRLTYDSASGEVRDDRKFTTMLEDYWLPRFAGGRGTQVETLPAGQNLGEMGDILYFQKRLYKSLNVPNSRLDSESSIYSLGRATEISRDEIKFSKFIMRLRAKFSQLFLSLLEKQLVLKQIVSVEEWEKEYRNRIKFRFNKDNYYDELKEVEVLNDRMNLLGLVANYVGRYYSNEWVRRNILRQTDEDMEIMDAQIAAETANPQYQLPIGIDPNVAVQQMQDDQMQQELELSRHSMEQDQAALNAKQTEIADRKPTATKRAANPSAPKRPSKPKKD